MHPPVSVSPPPLSPKHTLGIISILLIVAGVLLTGLFASQYQTVLQGRAADLAVDLEAIKLDNVSPSTIKSAPVQASYSSSARRFFVLYDPGKWSLLEDPDVTSPTTAAKLTNLAPVPDRASITIEVFASSDIGKNPTLSTFTKFYTDKITGAKLPFGKTEITDSKTTSVKETPSIKLDSKSAFLQNTVEATHYLFVIDNTGYVFSFTLSGNPGIWKNEIEIVLSSFSPGKTSSVQGASNSTELEEIEITALAQPSVVRIFNRYCATLQFIVDQSVPSLSGKKYPYCVGGFGSGFFVNSEGYIATNGHVVTIFDDESIAYAIASGKLTDLIVDIVEVYNAASGITVSREETKKQITAQLSNESFIALVQKEILKLIDGKLISILSPASNYYVQLGQEAFDISRGDLSVKDSAQILKAELVARDYEKYKSVEEGFTSSDVAIIKVPQGDYPTLSFAETDNLKVSQKLIIIGFPGVATDLKGFLDPSSSTEPTVTRGIVSSIKASSGNQKRLIQTDASITHGNSGGPGLDAEGRVIGLATYGLGEYASGGNYNFLRDIADLKFLMETKNIVNSSGNTSLLWKKALSEFWLSHYKTSVKTLGTVMESYPSHPTAAKYLAEAKAKIKAGQDKSPLFDKETISKIGTVSAVILAAIGIILLSLYIVRLLKHKKSAGVSLAR